MAEPLTRQNRDDGARVRGGVQVQAASARADALYRKVTRHIVPIVVVGYFFGYLDRVNVGFAKLQMLSSLHMSELAYGIGAGIFFWGYLLLQVPSGLLIHRIGARKCISIIMVAWGVVSMLTILTVGPHSFYVLRFLLGVVEAGFFPGVLLYFNYWFPSDRQAKIMSFLFLATPLGFVIGGPLSGVIMDFTHGALGLNGWQWLFLVEGAPAILLGLFLFAYLDDGIDQAKWLSESEKQMLKDNLLSEYQDKTESFVAALRAPILWLLVAICLLFNIGNYGLVFFLPTTIKEAGHLSVLTVSMLTAIPYAVGCVVMVGTAIHSERTGERRWHSALPPLVGFVALVLSTFYAHNPVIAMLFLTIGVAAVLALLAMFWGIPGRLLAGSAAAGGVGFINAWAAFAGFLAPVIVGWLTTLTGNTEAGVRVLAVTLLLSGLLVLAIPRRLLSRRA
jgi:MFS family permease